MFHRTSAERSSASASVGTGCPSAPASSSRVSAAISRPFGATEAYLATLSPAARARSDAYFEGGYWLQLWSFLYGLGVAWLLLGTGLSVRMRNLAERVTRSGFVHSLVYGAEYIVATALLGFPLAAYEGYFREHQYGMSNLTFPGWLAEAGKGLALGVVFGSVAIAVLYAAFRRAP